MTRTDLQADVEQRLAAAEPGVEVLACEPIGRDRLRIVIDHRNGVDLELCERVTLHLRDLLADFGLEVSSPGPERPLTKPDHYRQFVGRRARVRTRAPRDGRRNFRGELVGADDAAVTLAADAGLVAIPYAEIKQGNLEE
jgi:ribosome maturation factor RimP